MDLSAPTKKIDYAALEDDILRTHQSSQRIRNACQIAIQNGSNPIIHGGLNLSYSQIISLPDGLKVGEFLDLSYSQIISLPNDLEVGGNLLLKGTRIISLPKRLKVGGNLFLYNTQIKSLPIDLEIGGEVFVTSSQIRSIPKSSNELQDM